MKPLHLLAIAVLLFSCRGPRGAVSITVPEASTEGQATAVEASPDSLATPCDSLLEALRVIKIIQDVQAGRTDTVIIRDTVLVKAQAAARRAVQAIREKVCLWGPIDIKTDDGRITGRIWPAADGTPVYQVTCTEVKTDPVPCRCENRLLWWHWLVFGIGLAAAFFLGIRLSK